MVYMIKTVGKLILLLLTVIYMSILCCIAVICCIVMGCFTGWKMDKMDKEIEDETFPEWVDCCEADTQTKVT